MFDSRTATCLAAALAAGILSACAGPFADRASAADAMQARRDATLAGADWKTKQDISIEMHDYGYRPRELRLKAGQPYRLTLVNTGSVSHYFTAPEFFAAVAARKAEVPRQVEVKAAVFTSFEVHGRGGTVDFYFVPLEKGRYRAHCHIKDHLPLGIEGILVVE